MFPFLPQTLISILITIICSIFPCQWLVQLSDFMISAPLTSHTHEESLPRGGSVYRGMGNGTTDVDKWVELIEIHFGDLGDETTTRVRCLVRAESGGNPEALSYAGAHGLMQIMPFWAEEFGITVESLYQPDVNMWVARKVYEIQGWEAWDPYKRGSCR